MKCAQHRTVKEIFTLIVKRAFCLLRCQVLPLVLRIGDFDTALPSVVSGARRERA